MLRLYEMTSERHKLLRKIAKRSGDGIARTRAQVLSHMAHGRSIDEAAAYAHVSVQYARSIVREFNRYGMASLPRRNNGGRPPVLSREQVENLAAFVRKAPKVYGFPWTTWSIRKIHQAAVSEGIIPAIGYETLRRALRENGISYQRHRTWKHSNDPEFDSKRKRIEALCAKCPKRSAVICVDEFGPLECRPYMGRTWAERKRVPRLPATYNRPYGVRHMLAFYDVHADVLGGFFYDRKRGEEFMDFLGEVRKMYPRWMRLYIILDNFSPHKRKDVLKFARKNRMELVFTATNASWMNRIEPHFGALKKFALDGTFPRTHDELFQQIRDYLLWRNANRGDKTLLRELERYGGRLIRSQQRTA